LSELEPEPELLTSWSRTKMDRLRNTAVPVYNLLCITGSATLIVFLMQVAGEAYRLTARHVLDIMFNKFNLMAHLAALRKYLLLGQVLVYFYQNIIQQLLRN
jgi:hypothetical protein